MSVVNIVIDAAGARIYTDTLSYSATGEARPVGLCQTKCHIGAGFAMAFRGIVLSSATMQVLLDRCETYDDAVELLHSETTGATMAHFIARDRREFGGQPRRGVATEVTIAGWSAKEGRVTAYQRSFGEEGPQPVKLLPPGVHINPNAASLGRSNTPLPPTVTRQQAIKIAMAQQAVSLKFDLNMCIGGLLHETTVTRDGVVREIVAQYVGYAALAEQFGCPNAQELGCAA